MGVQPECERAQSEQEDHEVEHAPEDRNPPEDHGPDQSGDEREPVVVDADFPEEPGGDGETAVDDSDPDHEQEGKRADDRERDSDDRDRDREEDDRHPDQREQTDESTPDGIGRHAVDDAVGKAGENREQQCTEDEVQDERVDRREPRGQWLEGRTDLRAGPRDPEARRADGLLFGHLPCHGGGVTLEVAGVVQVATDRRRLAERDRVRADRRVALDRPIEFDCARTDAEITADRRTLRDEDGSRRAADVAVDGPGDLEVPAEGADVAADVAVYVDVARDGAYLTRDGAVDDHVPADGSYLVDGFVFRDDDVATDFRAVLSDGDGEGAEDDHEHDRDDCAPSGWYGHGHTHAHHGRRLKWCVGDRTPGTPFGRFIFGPSVRVDMSEADAEPPDAAGGRTEIWIEKYRPDRLADVKGHENIVPRLKRYVETDDLPHLMFAGPAGTGKTTAAQAVARELYGDDWQENFLELNASDQRGIDVVRDRIKSFARSSFGGYDHRIIFLDEADALTSDAQSALRRTMEQFSNNTRFILSCNYSSQIIDPIQSRCAVFRFTELSEAAIEAQVREIAVNEDIDVTDDGVDAIVYAAAGDMRKAINGLQAAAVMGEVVDEDAVFAITSTARPEEVEAMVEQAIDGDFTAARATLETLLTDRGLAGGDVIDQLHRSAWEFDLPETATVRLLERLGEVDYRITEGANERLQLEAMLAALALEDD